MGKSITVSIIFKGQSLNYGEGIGNISELKKLEVNYDELDGISVTAYTGDIVLNNAKILLKSENTDSTDTIKGDVNTDGKFNIADIVLLKEWLLAVPDVEIADWKAADLNKNNRLDIADFCLMKEKLLGEN